MHVLEA